MYNKIFKSDQVSVGIPVQIRAPISFQTIKMAYKPEMLEDNEEPEKDMEDLEEYNRKTSEDIIKKQVRKQR